MKLPKQWLHWCRLNNLRPEVPRRRYSRFYLIGLGRRWRVSDRGTFQVSEHISSFDRWAVSKIGEAPIPTTRDSFSVTVQHLLSIKREVIK